MQEDTKNPAQRLGHLTGTEIAGRFQLDRMLGQGGYGAVYEAVQLSVGRKCAVKVLVPNAREDPASSDRFEREARLTSQLAHPNTVVLYDFGYDATHELLYIAMEHIRGESLREKINRIGPLPLDVTLHIVHQVARSLQDAHDHGLVHRDVKPHNIMITRRGDDPNFVKVIDFGIARYRDVDQGPRVTKTGAVIGTPAYMSPEQVRGHEVDATCDQYSLAICVYRMLTGRNLFVGETPYDIAMKQILDQPLPLRVVRPDLEIDARFEEVVLRALAKDPSARFPTVRDFANALSKAAGLVVPSTISTEERRQDRGEGHEASEPTTRPMGGEAEAPEIDALAPTMQLDAPATTEPMEDSAGAVAANGGETLKVAGVSTEEDVDAFAVTAPAEAERIEPGPAITLPVAHAASTPRGPRPIVVGAVGLAAMALVVAVGVALFHRPVEAPPTERGRPGVDAVQREAPRPTETPAVTAVATMETADAGANVPAADAASATDVARPVLPAPAEEPPPAETATAKPPERESPGRPDANEKRPAPKPGKVRVTIIPWGTLYVNGRSHGDRPRQELTLPAGKHHLELRQNGTTRARKTVDVSPGQPTMVQLIAP